MSSEQRCWLIPLALAFLLDAAQARAEDANLSEAEKKAAAEEYVTVVTARRHEKAGSSVHTIKREEVVASGAHSAAELLEGEASIHANTGSRGERIFSLRGFSQRQVVVLVDGAPAYVPYDGQVDLNMIPAELVDHITVIKGPGSILYGPNGAGGAVNIVTRRPGAGPTAEVLAETGRSNFVQLSGYHSLRVARWLAYTVHGGLAQQDAFALSSRFTAQPGENGALRENSDRQAYNLGARFRLSPVAGHDLEAGLSLIDGSRGVPGSTMDSAPQYWRFTTWRAVNLTLAHAGRYLETLKIDEQLFVSLYDNLLDAYDDASFTTQISPMAFHSWYHDQIVGGRIRLRYRARRTPWGPTALRLWASVQHDRHEKDLEDGTMPVSYDRTIVTAAPEVEASFLGKWLSVTAALQVDVESPSEEGEPAVGLGPLLSFRCDPSEDLLLQATVARRTRFPTLRERFSSPGGFREPNPDLRPEVAWNLGLEVSWRAAAWLVMHVAVFDAEVEDLIEQVYLGSGKDKLENIAAARLLGGELALKLSPRRWLDLSAGYSVLHARRTDGLRDTDLLPYKPAHKASLKLRVAPWRSIELTSSVAVIGPQDFEHPETGAWGRLGPYCRWNARLSVMPVRWATIWVSAKNILDANYQTKYGYPDPGRQLFVGSRLSY
jgi:iron complex outermembrane receptor protein